MPSQRCRVCGCSIEYTEFLQGSPAKCPECGEIQRLGQAQEPRQSGSESSGGPQKGSWLSTIVVGAIAGCFLLCLGLCSGLVRFPGSLDPRVIESALPSNDRLCDQYVERVDKLGLGDLIDKVLCYENFVSINTTKNWSNLKKPDKIKAVQSLAQAWQETLRSPGDSSVKMVGLDANGNFSFTYESPAEIWVSD